MQRQRNELQLMIATGHRYYRKAFHSNEAPVPNLLFGKAIRAFNLSTKFLDNISRFLARLESIVYYCRSISIP